MLFNSFHFIVFLPIVVALYFSVPHRFRWMLLLIASYYFYMCWRVEYALLIMLSTMVDYYAGIQMGKRKERRKRTKFLILSLFVNLGLLFSFKYFNFFSAALNEVLGQFNIFYEAPTLKVLLPVGISFYTFQTLSYSIDVYRGKKSPEKHLGIFAVYVAFFPQLVAGPIERSTSLLPQFFRKNRFDYNQVTDGMKLMVWGFFKKLVIADNLALFVNTVYNSPHDYSGLSLALGTYLFAFQIFCDFSGYSDIAIGTAQMMGYRLMINFRQPYYSRSISEFWKRWHISLSTWFRDYLYIPLGGNQVVKWRWYFNLMAVFVISGLWHGANWTFIIWGALHGSYLLISIWTHKIREVFYRVSGLYRHPQAVKFIKIVITFHLVVFAWIFFRANTLSDAFYIIQSIFSIDLSQIKTIPSVRTFSWFISIISILIMEMAHFLQRKQPVRELLSQKPIYIRWALYYGALMWIILFGKFTEQEFIYFQF